MKKSFIILILMILLLKTIVAQPFGPPVYIFNPDTGECRYYFAGDEKHFNPRPENFTADIGFTADFKDMDEACYKYKCRMSDGGWNDGCYCHINSTWSNITGCTVQEKIDELSPKRTNIFSFLLYSILIALLLYSIIISMQNYNIKKQSKKTFELEDAIKKSEKEQFKKKGKNYKEK